MGVLTLGEKRKIKEEIRNDSRIRRLFGKLASILKQEKPGPDCSAFPISIETARIYNSEIKKQCKKAAQKEAEKSKCARRKVGAVLEKDGEIIGKGYNGVPYGLAPCSPEYLVSRLKTT